MKWSVMVTFIDGTPIYTVYRKAPTPQDAHWKEYAPNGSFYDIKEAQEYAEKLNGKTVKLFCEWVEGNTYKSGYKYFTPEEYQELLKEVENGIQDT